ncbi:transposase (plasmid) [Sinorhizobium americanum CCGM7]|nr:transposase [Sinorhizobium americanum CCGM7]
MAALGASSLSYVQARSAVLPTRPRRDIAVKFEICRVFEENFRVYSMRKVWRKVRRASTSSCTVARLMRSMGLQVIIRGKPIRTMLPDKTAPSPLD